MKTTMISGNFKELSSEQATLHFLQGKLLLLMYRDEVVLFFLSGSKFGLNPNWVPCLSSIGMGG